MKTISHTTLLRKSRNYRNEEAISRLAQMDSLKEWALQGEIMKFPPYQKLPEPKLTAGLYNFLRSFLP